VEKMSDLLHQLENNETILLMYIAGELPDEDRREVEVMLASDESLRAMYHELLSAWDGVLGGVEQLDASEAIGFAREAAARSVGRMVRQAHAARLAAVKPVAAVAAKPTLRFYLGSLSAAAAVVLVGFLVWWGAMADPDKVTSSGIELAMSGTGAAVNPAGRSTDAANSSSRDVLDAMGLSWVSPVDPIGMGDTSLEDVERSAEHLVDLGRGVSSTAEN
jgi:anti-sigma factor RsiW